MYVCMHACIMHACMYVCRCLWARMYARVYARVYACMHACMNECMHVCMHVSMYECANIYIYMYMLTTPLSVDRPCPCDSVLLAGDSADTLYLNTRHTTIICKVKVL